MAIVDVLRTNRLLHFVVLGGILFAIAPREHAERPVRVTVGEIEGAWRTEQARSGHLLSPAEKQRVVDDLVADKVLYREGRRLGIDASDPVVRARVAESMRTALAAAVPAVDPAEVDREAAALASAAPLRVKIDAWFVAKDRPEALQTAERLAEEIATGRSPRSPDVPPVSLDAFYTEETLARVAGLGVARAAFALPVGAAAAPVSSAWGIWIVRALERRPLAPAEVRDAAGDAVRRRKAAAEVARVVERASVDIAVDMPLGEPPYRRATGEM